MDELPEIDDDWGKRDRLLEPFESMVASGRVTGPEAARLRGARDPATIGAVVRAIRVRHAETRVGEAVEEGRMSREEADSLLERMWRVEHTRSLRGHLPSHLFGGRRGTTGSGCKRVVERRSPAQRYCSDARGRDRSREAMARRWGC